MNPTLGRITLNPVHRRRLGRLWQRIQDNSRDEAELAARRAVRAIADPSGQVREIALPPLVGDVTGPPGGNTVARIQGINVSPTDPTSGQGLRFNAGLGQWEPGAASSASYTIPVTEWPDPDADPVFVFDGGSVVVEEVPF